MTIAEARALAELVAGLVAVIGIPISVWRYFVNEAKKRSQEKAALYVEVNNRYLDFLALSLRYPGLGTSDRPANLELEHFPLDVGQNSYPA